MTHAGAPGLPASGWARGAALVAWTARLGLVLLVVAGVALGDRTGVALGLVFAAISLGAARIAPPLLDALLALVLLAHGWASLLERVDAGYWGPGMHLVAPFLVALILGIAAAEGRLGRPAWPRGAPAVALAGGLVVILAWELLELVLTRLPGVHIHTTRTDMVQDLALGGAAVVAAALVTAAVVRHRPRRS